MFEPLLATKLHAPPLRSDAVSRPRLGQRLAQAANRRLTLISAPAGYGKTTLVVAWLHQLPAGHCGWLSLDENDNDPVRFWVYVIATLRTAAPAIGEQALALLQSPHQSPLPLVLTFLVNDLAPQPEPLFLVLDDYHLIHNQSLHESVAFLLDHLPPQCHLVITSRVDPPLPLARLRARNQMLELRENDLRFTAGEAADFLQHVMGIHLPPAGLLALENRTEGWIVGLQLAAIAIQSAADQPAAVAAFSGSHRHLVDYLTEEVLAQQPEPVQHFLRHTAVLDRFCAPLCDAVLASATPAAETLLEQLDRAHLFLIPLDEERRWYRYHHLFTDLLRFRARQALDPNALRQLHRRAATWFEAADLWSEAIHHALAGEAYDLAGPIVARQAAPAVVRGELNSLADWLSALPAGQIEHDPRLALAKSWILIFKGQPDEGEQWLARAMRLAQGDLAGSDAFQGEVKALRATLSFSRQEMEQAIADSEQALVLLPDDYLPIRSLITWHLAYIYRSLGKAAQSDMTYRQAIALSERGKNAIIHASARRELASLLASHGQLATAKTMLRQLVGDVTERGWTHFMPVPGAYIQLAEIDYEWNQLESAAAYAQTAVALPQAPDMSLDAYGYALLARIYQAQGHEAAAAEAIEQARQRVVDAAHPQRRALTLAQISRFWIAPGEVVATWLPDGRDVPADPRHEVYTQQQIAHARYLAATGNKSGALALLAELLPAAEAAGRLLDVVTICLLQALWQDGAAAEAPLRQAVIMAEPAGLLRTFLDEGPALAALLNRLLGQEGVPAVYLGRLLAAFAQAAPPPLSQPLLEPLSDRELEVLRLLAEGYSNREIADKLVFTVATAKKHAEHIYGKLGVNSRTQAIARARELGLL
jgi:LuxR family maltose regulon positive regulatory protein